MARIRTIKPEFFTSEQIAECSTSARLLFVGMWVFSDDNGVHPASVMRLKMEVFPADAFTVDDMQRMLDELIEKKLVAVFNSGGATFWRIPSWRKHQKIEKPTYRHPTPPFDEDSTNDTPQNGSPRRGLGEDSPKSRRGLDPGMESNGVETKGRESKGDEGRRAESNGSPRQSKSSPASAPKRAPTQPAQDQPAQAARDSNPVRTSTGVPVTWAEAAEGMRSLKVSRIQASIEAAQANGFTPPQVLALIDVLRSAPAKQCTSPAGALYDRLTTPHASEWDATENWPWTEPATAADAAGSPSPYITPPAVAETERQRNEQERMDRARKFTEEQFRLETTHGATLNAMDEAALATLLSDQPELLRKQCQTKGRDSPDVRMSLLQLIDKRV